MAFALMLPFMTALDSNGNPISGAKLNVYAAGGLTPVDVYTTSALSIAHSNPVLTNSAGRFPIIFFAAGDYKLILTDASDVQLFNPLDNFHVEQEGTEIDFPTEVKTANFTVTAADRGKVFLVDASSGNITVSADSETLGSGFPFFIADRGASGTTTIAGTGAQTVDGAASVSISNQYSAIGFVSVGAAGWQSIATSDLSAFALLASANTFTANQTISTTTPDAGLTLRYNKASAGAANDEIGQIYFESKNDANANALFAFIDAIALDPSAASKDGELRFITAVANALVSSFGIHNGVVVGSPTGSYLGLGTINASAIYDDGVLLVPPTTLLGTITTTSGTSQALGSLVLTSYKFLRLVVNGVSFDGAGTISIGNSASDDVAVSGDTASAGASHTGIIDIDLTTGIAVSTLTSVTTTSLVAVTAITTATTTLTVISFGGDTFDAGTIKVYGIG